MSNVDEEKVGAEDGVSEVEIVHADYFLGAGFIFLCFALVLFSIAAWNLATGHESWRGDSTKPLYELILLNYTSAIMLLMSGLGCSFFGSRLLRAGGAATSAQVISPQDRGLIGPAIRAGNADAITQWIRLNSLTGWVGFFTKIGLTGLPLATIALTVFLAALGRDNPALLDMAKLTLGAFLGSFVQRQAAGGVPQTPPATKTPPS
jgi:uncharacterized membrane protein